MRSKLIVLLTMIAMLAMVLPSVTAQDGGIELVAIGSYASGAGEGAAEISAYDAGSQTLIVTNGATSTLDFISLADPANPELIVELDLEEFGGAANSVDVYNGVAAVTIDGAEASDPGSLLFFNVAGEFLTSVEVGVVPDMVTFTPDGSTLLVANEAEPNDDYSIDPEGSISIVDFSGGVEGLSQDSVITAGFEAFNDNVPEGVRVFGPDATVAQDLEPEYIAVSPDGATAYAVLQENNAVAVVDVASAEVTAIVPLGFKDHSVEGNGFDASNEDGAINIQTWPTLGMYQPDAIYAIEIDGAVYLLTANEGDSRDYDGYSEETRVADLPLDPDAFPNAEELQMESNLGRLNTTTANGDTDGDGDFDLIYSYGARSFTVWGADGSLIFDSGDEFEQIFAEIAPERFNSQGDAESFDNRSDDKGPEPEGIVAGFVNDVPYAFIGLERIGGVLVYDLTDPTAPTFVTYAFNEGDIAPEGLVFISADESPNGNPLLVVTNEVSGTVTVFEVQ